MMYPSIQMLFRGPNAKLITKDSVREGLLNGELEICKKCEPFEAPVEVEQYFE